MSLFHIPELRPQEGGHYEMLKRIGNIVSYMIKRHKKVLFIRFDLINPIGFNDPNGKLLSKFIVALNYYCKKRNYSQKYIWIKDSYPLIGKQYYFILLLNGNKVQSPFCILEKITELWSSCLRADAKGFVDYNESHKTKYAMIIKKDPTYKITLQDCFIRSFNMAKKYNKHLLSGDSRGWGMSRIGN